VKDELNEEEVSHVPTIEASDDSSDSKEVNELRIDESLVATESKSDIALDRELWDSSAEAIEDSAEANEEYELSMDCT